MRSIIVIAVCLLTFASCTKKSSSTGSGGGSSVSLNATETSLLGTWYEIKFEQRLPLPDLSYSDSVYTGYDKSCFVTFTKDPYFGTTTTSNAGNYKNANLALSPGFLRSWPGAAPAWWYYNESTKFLQLGANSYEIISLSGSSLIIKSNKAGMILETYYLSR
jgi:hypothetical protein